MKKILNLQPCSNFHIHTFPVSGNSYLNRNPLKKGFPLPFREKVCAQKMSFQKAYRPAKKISKAFTKLEYDPFFSQHAVINP